MNHRGLLGLLTVFGHQIMLYAIGFFPHFHHNIAMNKRPHGTWKPGVKRDSFNAIKARFGKDEHVWSSIRLTASLVSLGCYLTWGLAIKLMLKRSKAMASRFKLIMRWIRSPNSSTQVAGNHQFIHGTIVWTTLAKRLSSSKSRMVLRTMPGWRTLTATGTRPWQSRQTHSSGWKRSRTGSLGSSSSS